MNLSADKTAVVSAAAHSHAVFVGVVTELFNTLQEFVRGTCASHDISIPSQKLRDEMLRDDPNMPERLVLTWEGYVKSLTGAYQTFAHEIPHRLGSDDQSHVRNFALNTAAGAFTSARESSRKLLMDRLEGATFTDRPARAEFKEAFVESDQAA
ncbi:MAG TPA: hypothetical protein V6C97_19030 [Oculatellaceae cyanobacterium]